MAVRTSTATGNLSAGATWVGGVAPVDGDQIILLHAVTIDTDITLGAAGPTTPTTAPTVNLATGASATSLPTGTYRVAYAWVDGSGNISNLVADVSTGAITNGVSQPRVTIPALPTGVVSANIYLTDTGGATNTCRLYATGVTGTTCDLISASYMDGTQTYANATQRFYYSASAIWFSSATTGKTLTVNTGVTVTLQGDVIPATSNTSTLQLNAGSVVSFKPPASQRYIVNCGSTFTNLLILGSGTSGSHVTWKTDTSLGGLAGYVLPPSSGTGITGFSTCSYVDFTDWGGTTSATAGVRLRAFGGSNAVSITNCTGLRSNLYSNTGSSWDGNATFSENVFTSSTSFTGESGAACGMCIAFGNAATSGVWSITLNGCDLTIDMGTVRAATSVTKNVSKDIWSNGGSATDIAKFAENICFDVRDMPLRQPGRNCYMFSQDSSNPHMLVTSSVTGTISGFVFETVSTDGTGEAILPAATGSLTADNNIILETDTSGAAGCKLAVGLGTTTWAITARHNTQIGSTDSGLIHVGEGGTSYAGEIPDCRSNLICRRTAGGTGVNAVSDFNATAEVVTLATHNAFWNGGTNTCYYNTSTSQANVLGYLKTKVALNSPYPNAQIGANDVTITSDPFVDITRNLKKWGAYKGTAETNAAAIAYAVANPTAATDATTGLVAWVKDGFKVTGSQGLSLKDAGHDGVTIGAMGYVAESDGGGIGSARGLRLLRP